MSYPWSGISEFLNPPDIRFHHLRKLPMSQDRSFPLTLLILYFCY